ncbi:tRNA (guanine(46)-N(7))-methyltransferase TrmB [Corallincola platygyrae]|uniref:tRNA (guanine(46)-N(7))-methyltransferase n=1 Tax=Corallincola platygyrae TaxID=1193278 RepID=A0ABW4XQT4_9GAMM
MAGSEGNSRSIESNQSGLHERLDEVVRRHLEQPFQKPIAERSQALFETLSGKVQAHGGPVILDSCCGVGESTRRLALQHPNALVIGMDKSADRIEREFLIELEQADNYLLARADLNDLWRLIAESDWPVTHHYLLYPNPWPKSKHLQRRWHGAAVFPYLLQIGGQLELRSNWKLYLEEFAQALGVAGQNKPEVGELSVSTPLTPFERKYQASGQALWQLVTHLS